MIPLSTVMHLHRYNERDLPPLLIGSVNSLVRLKDNRGEI